MSKVAIVSVIVHRVEGYSHECRPVVKSNLAEANMALRSMARTAPDDGTYAKTDFKVMYEDGNTYEGRIDLMHHHMFDADLGQHMRDHLTFYAGERCPEALSEERYRNYLRDIVDPEKQQAAREFLAKYEVGLCHQRRSSCGRPCDNPAHGIVMSTPGDVGTVTRGLQNKPQQKPRSGRRGFYGSAGIAP